MNRIFGYGKRKTHDQLLRESSQAMTQAQQGLQTKISQLDTQITQINMQLQTIQRKLNATRSVAGKKPLRSQALKLLNKRKRLEQMRESLDNQDWSMQQAQMMSDTLQNTMLSVNALTQSNKALRAQYGKINVEKLEDMQDEMAELLEKGEELQSALHLNADFADVDDISESELDAELEALAEGGDDDGDEELLEALRAGDGLEGLGTTEDGQTVPSYLSNAVPKFIDEDAETTVEGKNKEELEKA